jgi:hypothetical protein
MYSTQFYSFDPVTGLMVPFVAQWMDAAPGAPPLGVRHQYTSYNWTKGIPFTEQVGEIIGASRPWRAGPADPNLLGSNHCGAGPLWTGKLTRLTTPIPVRPNGEPACCDAGAVCTACPGNIGSSTYTMDVAGATGSMALWNGSWSFFWVSPCNWDTNGPDFNGGTFNQGSVVLANLFIIGTTPISLRSNVTWDCHHPLTDWTVTAHPAGGTPPSYISLHL